MDQRLEAELKRVRQAFFADFKAAHATKVAGPKIPPVVYHYTSADGLEAILRSGDIWMSDIFSMNDPSELIWGVCAAMEAVEARAQNASRQAQVMASLVPQIPTIGMSVLGARFTSTSFSTADDDLGQWRAYGANGDGYAIAFHTPAIVGAFTQSHRALELGIGQLLTAGCFTIAYDDNELLRRQTALVKLVFDAAEIPQHLNLSLDDDDPFFKQLFDILGIGVIENSLGYKHMAYANEKEYRFLLAAIGIEPPNSFIHGPAAKGVLKTKFNWREPHPNAIAGILMGPALDKTKADAFIQETLRKYGHQPVQTGKSKIPYRWRF